MEHRWGNRFPANIDVRLFALPASGGSGRIRDISVSGAFIESAVPLPALSCVHITLNDDSPVLCAMVVRRTESGFAVEWADPDAPMVAELVREARSAELLSFDSTRDIVVQTRSWRADHTW